MIDPKKIYDLYNNDEQKVKKILTIYATILPDQFNQLSKGFEEKDIKKIQSMAHTLKTSFRYLGLEELSNTAKKTEEKCEAGKPLDKIEPLYIKLMEAQNPILDNLNKIIQNPYA